jgi:subtilisin
VFTTVTVESDPIIDSYSVSDAGSPNPHAEINTEWAVSDADGDLSAVTVSISDYSSETTLRSSETSVSDTNASGSDSFKIKHSDGAAFDVTLRVKDNAGNAASETKSISA